MKAQNLRQHLLLDYEALKVQLARRLGSVDRADDALHDAWLRLDNAAPAEPVRSPFLYLLRTAYRLALKRRLKERERVTLDDVRTALSLADDAPDPERVAMARSDIEAVRGALAELSPRRRHILLAARVEGRMLRNIAEQLGLSQRMVELELKAAVLHCGRRLEKKIVQRFGPKALKSSDNEDCCHE
ncbi:RNA polymerase sigma factor [Tardiphaga sp. 172_B4_N1_3]|uniref:RNA polymerase sigma factor n=1 Tax=Tardiphaga sp. 172_B4_N1_3 TaxID=3240787 RepID=UPI003F8AE9A3